MFVSVIFLYGSFFYFFASLKIILFCKAQKFCLLNTIRSDCVRRCCHRNWLAALMAWRSGADDYASGGGGNGETNWLEF